MNDTSGQGQPYTGPPENVPPPPGWKVREVIEPQPPRRLPKQDGGAIDAAELRAKTLTHGLAILFGSLMLVVLLIVLIRAMT